MERRAKIVATLGPASSDPEVLSRLFEAGLDVVRLNLSHGTKEDHRRVIRTVRRLSQESGRFVPIIADLMGPRYRLGEIAEGPRYLEVGEEVTLGEGEVDLPVEDPGFLDHLRAGERILIDNGLLELEIHGKRERRVEAVVLNGGPVSTRKGINLPDTDLPFVITPKDSEDIAFVVAERVDFLAVSFVGAPEDLSAVRGAVQAAGGALPLVAKLERATAVRDIGGMVRASDAVMVARGDLGVEMPLHEVPVLQKKIIGAGRKQGKPVIVATQMLESMMEHPRPSRAEASDVANAVFDSADALMLSGETAVGRHPVEAVRTMSRIIAEAESFRLPPALRALEGEGDGLGTDDFLRPLLPGLVEKAYLSARDVQLDIPNVVCAAAVYAAGRLQVKRIVAFSQGGFTARMIARYRPPTPIVVFTRDAVIARRLQLVWGAQPALVEDEVDDLDEVVRSVDGLLLDSGQAEAGDIAIILMGAPVAEKPLTNLIRIHRVRSRRKA